MQLDGVKGDVLECRFLWDVCCLDSGSSVHFLGTRSDAGCFQTVAEMQRSFAAKSTEQVTETRTGPDI